MIIKKIVFIWGTNSVLLLSFASAEVNGGIFSAQWTNLALILSNTHNTQFNRGYVVYTRADYLLLCRVKFPMEYTVKPYLEKLKEAGYLQVSLEMSLANRKVSEYSALNTNAREGIYISKSKPD